MTQSFIDEDLYLTDKRVMKYWNDITSDNITCSSLSKNQQDYIELSTVFAWLKSLTIF